MLILENICFQCLEVFKLMNLFQAKFRSKTSKRTVFLKQEICCVHPSSTSLRKMARNPSSPSSKTNKSSFQYNADNFESVLLNIVARPLYRRKSRLAFRQTPLFENKEQGKRSWQLFRGLRVRLSADLTTFQQYAK